MRLKRLSPHNSLKAVKVSARSICTFLVSVYAQSYKYFNFLHLFSKKMLLPPLNQFPQQF